MIFKLLSNFLSSSQKENYEETVGLNSSRYNEEDDNHRKKKIYKKDVKPNGGWGWAVVLGVAISNASIYLTTATAAAMIIMMYKIVFQMTTQSLISVFGLLFIQRFSDLGITTKGASIIMGMQTTSLNLSGLIIGPVIKKYSYRKTAAMGAILVVVGLLLTRHADSLIKFIFSYSLFTG